MRRAIALGWLTVTIVIATTIPATPQTPTPPSAAPDGWVVLPVDEYRLLRDRAFPQPPRPEVPPVEATLTRVDYDLRIEGDTVTGRAALTIDLLREGWTRVQIPAGLMARAARLDGQPVALIAGTPPAVLLSRAGRSVVELDISLRLTASGGGEAIVLPPSRAAVSRATIALPRGGVDVQATGGFVSDRSETPTETRWTAFGQPGQALTLAWKRRIDDRRAEQPLRVRARLTSVVGLGEELSTVVTAVRVEVVQGLAREVVLTLPDGLAVNQVDGPTIGDWTATGGFLRVRLLDPVATEASFVVQGESRTPREGQIAVPLLRMPSAERETGGVAVDVVGAGEIDGRQARGLEPADPSELGEPVTGRASPSMAAFRSRPLAGNEPRALTVSVVRYTPQAVLVANVEEARHRVLLSEDGRMLVHASFAVRNNQRSFLKVMMPAGATLWSAKVSGRPIRPGVAEEGAVLLPLEKGRPGDDAPTFVLELTYLQRTTDWLDKGLAALVLPSVDLPVSRTGVRVSYSPRFSVTPQPGSFRVTEDPGPMAEAFQSPTAVAAAPPPARQLQQQGAAADAGRQALVDRFQNETGARRVVGNLPVDVSVPEFGPSLFLASELLAEGVAPSVELTFKRTK